MSLMPRNLRAALLHGEYMKADASYRFAPLDVPHLRLLQENWDLIRLQLAGDDVTKFDVFDGLHFSHEKFERVLVKEGLDAAWPRTLKSRARRLDKETWETMAGLNPDLEALHQLYKTLKMPKLNIACDPDGRNRILLGAFGAITSRNTPGSDSRGTFIFAPAKWTRFLIKPPEGRAVAYIDWACQEYGIGAILSGDQNMLRSYEAGDPYLSFAILAGAAPAGATKSTHPVDRKLYKSATLAIGYGQTVWGFCQKTRVSKPVAERVFRDYQRLYPRFLAWREKQVDSFGISLHLSTKLGWTLHQGARVKPNTVLNFTAQATGAEMLRLAVIEMMRRGVRVCCPIHDAVLIEAPVNEIDSAVAEARASMDVASVLFLGGYKLRNEVDVFRFPERFFDKDGAETWCKVSAIVETLKQSGVAAT
jgi:DNA polymerase-1